MEHLQRLKEPKVGWSRYGRKTVCHVETVDGSRYLGVDNDGDWFIDTTCTFIFDTVAEALEAARDYYTSYGLVYPYVQGRDGKFIRTDIYPAATIADTESQVMEFI